jgi:hypothetical protein
LRKGVRQLTQAYSAWSGSGGSRHSAQRGMRETVCKGRPQILQSEGNKREKSAREVI